LKPTAIYAVHALTLQTVRLLDNWEVLNNYFILATVEDKTKSAVIILALLNDDSIKAYLLFLKYSLNFLNNFNALF